jgi:hypothetical protein
MTGGLVTALAEGGLFAIYYNRRENARKYREKRRERQKARLNARYLKAKNAGQEEDAAVKDVDGSGTDSEVPVEAMDKRQVDVGPLRRRNKGGDGGVPNEEDS